MQQHSQQVMNKVWSSGPVRPQGTVIGNQALTTLAGLVSELFPEKITRVMGLMVCAIVEVGSIPEQLGAILVPANNNEASAEDVMQEYLKMRPCYTVQIYRQMALAFPDVFCPRLVTAMSNAFLSGCATLHKDIKKELGHLFFT